jgi:superfamily II DNA or RNA helicase
VLPKLIEVTHNVDIDEKPDGMLFTLPAVNLFEQRIERKRTLTDRCERAAELATHGKPAVVWCHANEEGDLLEKLIPDAVQVSGKDNDDRKEQKFEAFSRGDARVMITKPKIGAWGLNWQHASSVVYFPSHSYEQYYQAIRRCWRFGQKNDVTVDIVMTEGEKRVLDNLQAKSSKADVMFQNLVTEMNNSLGIKHTIEYTRKEEFPAWL